MKRRVLLIEGDERLGSQTVRGLAAAGYETTWLRNGREAMAETTRGASLVILDLTALPGAPGLDVLKRLRRESDLPLLVLSSSNATRDKVRAFDLGADDYVAKPFSPEELLARVAARLRRPALQRSGTLQLGPLRIDLEGRQAAVGGEPVSLTRVEFDLLAALARRPGAAVSRAALARTVLDPERAGGERTLDVHASRLRKKLGRWGGRVVTVRGVGYRLDSP